MPDDPIKHVVVLALENHSFDQMLGCLKELYPELEGVTPGAPNKNVDHDGTTYLQDVTEERQMPFDPHHEVPYLQSTGPQVAISTALAGVFVFILWITK